MPYKRSNKKIYRRKRGHKLNPRQMRQVKTVIARRQELKYYIVQVNGANVSSTVGVNPMTEVTQGDTDSQRDGDRLQLCGNVSIYLNFVGGSGATGDLYNTYRFVVFQWHPAVTTPAAGDVLLNGPTGAVDVYSQYSHDNRQMYKILYDKLFTTVGYNSGIVSSATANNYVINRRINISLKKATKYIQYAGGGLTGTNKLFYILCSDSGVATHPTYSFSSKVFFRDS